MESSISRRGFVAGATAAAVAATGLALGGRAEALQASDVAGWDYEADVVVCGSGAGGASAAVEAADNGAEVIVIEKKDWAGGQLRRCGGGVMAAGTQVQAKFGIEDDADSMFEYWKAMGQGLCDEELVRDYCDNSASIIDWIIDDLGGEPLDQWEISGDDPQGLEYTVFSGLNIGVDAEQMRELGFDPVARCHWFTQNPDDELIGDESKGLFPTAGGTGLYKTFADAMDARGVQVMLETALTRLVVADGTNEVVGVVAQQGESQVFIRARRGVVVATGNFATNRDMHLNYTLEDYTANDYEGFGQDLAEENDGSGFNACVALGAAPKFPGKLNKPLDHSLDGDYAFMLGGLTIDAQARAIDVFGEPIPRLYLSSALAGGVIGGAYPACGASVGRNLYFGRVAGREAASQEPLA
ncbi:MAG: FAD-dependent oxidoreductase [Coriobacteriales bacterium]|jgi:succinate dehydrogenase/fumarate reductase flavoprotein subunit